MWAFTPCIQGDRAELSFIQAMKEAKRLAKGNYYIKIFFQVVILAILCLFWIFYFWVWSTGYFTCRSCRFILCLRSMQELTIFNNLNTF